MSPQSQGVEHLLSPAFGASLFAATECDQSLQTRLSKSEPEVTSTTWQNATCFAKLQRHVI